MGEEIKDVNAKVDELEAAAKKYASSYPSQVVA